MSTPDYDRSVFINCPFDSGYQPLLHCIVFTVAASGLHPRCALELSTSSEPRISRIAALIRGCRFGIHDLSRNGVDPSTNLARFNMPLELGMFLGAVSFGDAAQRAKVCLVVDRAKYEYEIFASDLAGQDIAAHGDSPQQACASVRDWLASHLETPLPSSSSLWDKWLTFNSELDALCASAEQKRAELTYADFRRHVSHFLSSGPDTLEGPLLGRIENPTPFQVRTALHKLAGGADSFAILGKSGSGLTYLQTRGGGGEPFVVEYQDGSLGRHYEAVNSVDLDAVIDLFTRYRLRDQSWTTLADWRELAL